MVLIWVKRHQWQLKVFEPLSPKSFKSVHTNTYPRFCLREANILKIVSVVFDLLMSLSRWLPKALGLSIKNANNAKIFDHNLRIELTPQSSRGYCP